jgi:hypothetical protein
MTTPISLAVFDDDVARFQSDLAADPHLYDYGQFYITGRTIDGLKALVHSLAQSDAHSTLDPGLVGRVDQKLEYPLPSDPSDPKNVSSKLKDITDFLEANGLNGIKTKLFAPGAPNQSDNSNVQRNFHLVWSNPDIPDAPPYIVGEPTYRKMLAAYAFEKDKCFLVGTSMSKKLLSAHKVKSLSPDLKISACPIAGARINPKVEPYGLPWLRLQTVSYNPTELAKIEEGMRKAIDNKGMVLCGVLSGLRQDNNLFKNPEHYVSVFAYGKVEGKDAFLFWDPDANHSDISTTKWGPGFGCLFSSAQRLSTGIDDIDLGVIDVNGNHLLRFSRDNSGNQEPLTKHDQGYMRHRYQVYFVQTLPL